MLQQPARIWSCRGLRRGNPAKAVRAPTEPATTLTLPEDYVERVKAIHTDGGFGSIGYRSEWKLEEAKKNILRTHTTAVSARMLYKLAQEVRHPRQHVGLSPVRRAVLTL